MTVRRVDTLEDYAASQEIPHVAFGVPEAARAAMRERDAVGFEHYSPHPTRRCSSRSSTARRSRRAARPSRAAASS